MAVSAYGKNRSVFGWARVFIAILWVFSVVRTAAAQRPEITPADNIEIHAPTDLGEMTDRPIERIELVQTGRRWRSPARMSSLHVGDPWNSGSVRRAARELLASGGFSNVSIAVSAAGDGVVLTFSLTPRRLIAAKRLQGAAFDDSDVWQETPIAPTGELTEAMLPRIAESVRLFHVRRGYPNAVASIETRETDDPMRVVLVVEVTPGPARVFAGRQIVIPANARLDLGEVVESYDVARDDRVDDFKLEEADRKLAELLRARVYPQAHVQHVVKAVRDQYFLYVYVTPGPRLRFRFEGNHVFDSDQLTDAIEYEQEVDRSASHLAEKIAALYRSMGLLDVVVEPEERGGATDATHEIVFKIIERQAVRVTSRVFPCLSGPRSASEVASEIDSFLEEELPGGGLLGPVDPAVVDQTLGPTQMAGNRPPPAQPEPTKTFVPSVYDKAIKHLQDLYRSEGFLSATVGPPQLVRRTCDRRSPPGHCVPLPLPSAPANACTYDAKGLPLEETEQPRGLLCRPDRARATTCAGDLEVRIPVKLGPRATLYDLAFEGNRTLVETKVAQEAGLVLGSPASNLELEQARRRILDVYRELGFAYAEVRATLELSPDHTRARARFTINESEQVYVERIVVRGAVRTNESLILRRVALEVGGLYQQSLVRKSEERIATLGTFSNVAVSLDDPYVPARRKTVVVQVQERLPQYLDIRPGFSTGEGFRAQFEYGHRNIVGEAIQFTFRIRLGYLPDVFILDPDVRRNLSTLPVSQRMERRNTVSVLFPEIGLGPLISLGVDGIDVRSNARDFGLSKNAVASSLNYRPARTFATSLGGSLERNDVAIFNGQTVLEYLSRPGVTSDLVRLLRVPDGLTYVVAQRVTVSWDRRDLPLGATRGTLATAGVEHVRAFPATDNPNSKPSDFLRTTGSVAGYLRLSRRGLVLAASLRAGFIQQLLADSKTYPDRLFFLGGVDSLRGFLQDSVVPQDVAEKIIADAKNAQNDPTQLTVSQVAIRGGDVFINPRTELRIPLSDLVQTALFLDSGNVWVEPRNLNPVVLRYAAGSGLRIGTPIGPIALDYGINLVRRSWEDFGAFHFSIGLF